MGKPPKTAPEAKTIKSEAPKAVKQQPPKKLNCIVMPDKPEKPGLTLISTNRIQDGCYVLGWQPQATVWLVSEGQEWYSFSSKLLKANLAFTSVFALSVLILLFINRVR